MPRDQKSSLSAFMAMLIVVITALLTAVSGNGPALPLDSHEVFVARTAEEMIARKSVIVPFLNDEPRVKKPPLAYWLVMLTDRLGDNDGIISEWEARVPSMISGVLMAGLTFLLGCVLFNRAAGIVAGLILASSGSFVTYTHSARPEMMYAMCCTAGILGFALSDRASKTDGPRRPWLAWLGWLMMGLAVLTKGPQLPLPIIAGWIIAMLAAKRHAAVLPVLRPFSGVLIMAAVSAWWYIALWRALPGAWKIWQGETVDKYFSAREPASRYLDPFYLYRTAQLMLPWLMLFVVAALSPRLKEFRSNRQVRLLWWAILTPIIVLSISLGRRDYYMLPITGAAAALMATAGVEVGRTIWRRRAWLWKTLAALHILGLAAAVFVMSRTEPPSTRPPTWALIIMAPLATAAMIALFLLKKNRAHETLDEAAESRWWQPSDAALTAATLVGAAFFVGAAANQSLWGADRRARRDFSLRVREAVPHDAALLGWLDIWDVDQYYNHRTIPSFPKSKTLAEALEARLKTSHDSTSHEVWLLVSFRDDPRRPRLDLSPEYVSEVHLSVTDEDNQDTMQLWRVTSAQ